MYYDYYGLTQAPFRITPDTSLFFPGGDRGAILEAMIYAITSGEGIVKLVGEVGSGKTTLCRMLEKELPGNVEVVYLANPRLSPDNILHAIAFELHIKVSSDESRFKVMNEIQQHLLKRHAENKQVVVFVEEAQGMPIPTLEEIRLLSNLETAQSKLLQIVLFGQPELDSMIALPEIRQLKERITYSFYLSPLKATETKDYINTRLRACGYRKGDLFDDKAIAAIAKYSKGLLRRINILADKSLLAGYAANANKISVKAVKKAARETEFVSERAISVSQKSWKWPFLITAAVLLITVSILFFKTTVINDTYQQLQKAISTDATNKIEPKLNNQVSTKSMEKEPELAPEIAEEDVPLNNYKLDDSPKPNPDDLQTADWQNLISTVYVYPEESIVENKFPITSKENKTRNIITYLLQNRPDVTDDERELLQQLEKIPPEVALKIGSELKDTCNICSTIIYRPLKAESKL